MGLLDGFIGQLQEHGLLGELGIELDLIRSEYPTVGGAKGFLSIGAIASGSLVSFSLQVPSGMAFHLKTLIIDNQAEKRGLWFYDGPGVSVPMFVWTAEQSTSDALGNQLVGLLFQSIPMVSFAGSQCYIRIGGLIRERTAD